MIEFNLLVTYSYDFLGARREIGKTLTALGDPSATIRRTIIKGIVGVVTSLNPHELWKSLQNVVCERPNEFWYTQRWIPVDLWTTSDIQSMKQGVLKVARIGLGERWMMVVEKRRYEALDTPSIIRQLAEVIDAKVDLSYPDLIIRVDILGPFAGIGLLHPGEVFSALRRNVSYPPSK